MEKEIFANIIHLNSIMSIIILFIIIAIIINSN